MAALIEYPQELPAPQISVVSPTERRYMSNIYGRPNARAFQRDFHGQCDVSFIYKPLQAEVFKAWFDDWAEYGGGWFAANWPLPQSRVNNVYRFIGTPRWALVGGAQNGQGYWRVTATVEIRGRGMLPAVEVENISSHPYPTLVVDGVGVKAEDIKPPPNTSFSDAVGVTCALVGLSYTGVVYGAINMPPEDAVTVSASFIGLSYTQVVYGAINMPPEDAVAVSGTLVSLGGQRILITYSNYEPEGVGVAGTLINIGA